MNATKKMSRSSLPREAVGERDGEKEREQHLDAGQSHAELVEELDQLAVAALLLALSHGEPHTRATGPLVEPGLARDARVFLNRAVDALALEMIRK